MTFYGNTFKWRELRFIIREKDPMLAERSLYILHLTVKERTVGHFSPSKNCTRYGKDLLA